MRLKGIYLTGYAYLSVIFLAILYLRKADSVYQPKAIITLRALLRIIIVLLNLYAIVYFYSIFI